MGKKSHRRSETDKAMKQKLDRKLVKLEALLFSTKAQKTIEVESNIAKLQLPYRCHISKK